MKQGPTGNRVASNVKEARRRCGFDLKELSARLERMGHQLNFNGLSKIENGLRRVDTDDLVALALVLDVTPDWLLVGDVTDDQPVRLTGKFETTARRVWRWLVGDAPLKRDLAKAKWRATVRPDSPSLPGIHLPTDAPKALLKEAFALFERAEAEGIDLNGLVTLYEWQKPLEES